MASGASAAVAEPDWLAARRAESVQALGTLAMPTFRGTPGWEFTPIDKLDLDAYEAAPGGDPVGVDDAVRVPDGAVRAGAGAEHDDPPGGAPLVLALSVAAERHPELVRTHLGSTVPAATPLVAHNDARWTDGWLVRVPREVVVREPIVVSTVHERPGSALHHRLLVVLEEGAEAEVWHQTLSAPGAGEGLVNGVVELVVGEGARLALLDVQDVSERTWVFGAQRAIVRRDGHLDWTALGFGGADGKVFLETNLAGRGAHAAVTGAYASRGRQHLDFDTLQEHAAPDTTSDLAFRGVLAGRSSTVWRGMIKVDPGSQRTDAFQESRNLLLSKRAHADAIPGLEILADDVRCTHAAAIAQIDPEQLFYLRSHGLGEDLAQRLVIEGFLGALLERYPEGTRRDAVAGALARRLELVLG
ncbi:MAG TPA: Fe-S cluster assembly protein SufD [Solirubrobacteraceae bacterium]|nr:Fe-S cluster assembly protein SufD [Solirubrobacteraceae bacterium]